MLNFYQYKIHESSQTLHAGPLKPTLCKSVHESGQKRKQPEGKNCFVFFQNEI